MRIRKIAVVAASLAAIGATAGPAGASAAGSTTAPATQAATRQFEGTIVSVDRSAGTFRLRAGRRTTVTIEITSRTRFQRVGGFAGLRPGMTRIEANVRRANDAWVATFVERAGGGGRHGGSDD